MELHRPMYQLVCWYSEIWHLARWLHSGLRFPKHLDTLYIHTEIYEQHYQIKGITSS